MTKINKNETLFIEECNIFIECELIIKPSYQVINLLKQPFWWFLSNLSLLKQLEKNNETKI